MVRVARRPRERKEMSSCERELGPFWARLELAIAFAHQHHQRPSTRQCGRCQVAPQRDTQLHSLHRWPRSSLAQREAPTGRRATVPGRLTLTRAELREKLFHKPKTRLEPWLPPPWAPLLLLVLVRATIAPARNWPTSSAPDGNHSAAPASSLFPPARSRLNSQI